MVSYYRRTVEYFNEILHIAENMQILYDFEPQKGKTNLKICLKYIKALVQSNNTDKLKLILDSKIVAQAFKYLGYDDVHIRGEILEILYELSKAFEMTTSKQKNELLQENEEDIKTIGLLSHLSKTGGKDKAAQNSLFTNSYAYYSLNKLINNKYLTQIAYIFESPIVFTLMTIVIKTQAELLQNKTFVIKIFENLTNSPASILKSLNFASTDTILSLCKMLVVNKRGIDLKQNTILAPILVEALNKVIFDVRPEMIDMLNNVPTVRPLLQEQNLDIPPKLTLTLIYEELQKLDKYFMKIQDTLGYEIQQVMLASKIETKNKRNGAIYYLNNAINHHNTVILSWLRHYFKPEEDEFYLLDVRNCFNKTMDLYIEIFNAMQEYGQLVDICTETMQLVTRFNYSNFNF